MKYERWLCYDVTDVVLENVIEDAMQFFFCKKASPEKSCKVDKQLWSELLHVEEKKCRWKRKWQLGLDQPLGR